MHNLQSSISLEQLQTLLEPLSHDLKNKLTNIYLYAQMLDKNASEQQKKSSTKVLKNIQNFDEHLTVVGEFIKTFYNQYTYRIETIELKKCIEELKQAFPNSTFFVENIGIGSVAIDLDKLVRLLKVWFSRYTFESVEMHIIQNETNLNICIKGTPQQSLPFSEDLTTSYMQKVLTDMNLEHVIAAQPYDLVITLHTH